MRRAPDLLGGGCLDSVGGWYQGYVDVDMVYIGTPQEISARKNQVIGEINQGLQQLQVAVNNQPCTSPPNIQGLWTSDPTPEILNWQISQNQCEVTGDIPTSGFTHKATLAWNGSTFQGLVRRQNRADGCVTQLNTTLSVISPNEIRVDNRGLDTNCDLSINFTSSYTMRRSSTPPTNTPPTSVQTPCLIQIGGVCVFPLPQ